MIKAVQPESLPFFGRVALKNKLVTLSQIQECVAEQLEDEAGGYPRPRLGELLVRKGYLTPEQVQAILKVQKDAENSDEGPVEITLAAGKALYKEGDQDNFDLFILLRGKVDVFRNSILLAEFDQSGIFLGETSTLLKQPRPTTIIAKSDCRLYRIPQQRVDAFFRSKPAMAIRLAELMAERLYNILNKHIGHDSTEPSAISIGTPLGILLTEAGNLKIYGNLESRKTFINGYPAEKDTDLKTGDRLQFGPHIMEVTLNHPDALTIKEEAKEDEANDAATAAAEIEEEFTPPEPEAEAIVIGEGENLTKELITESLDSIKDTPFRKEVLEAVADRMMIYESLDRIEEKRIIFASKWSGEEAGEMPEEVKAEFERQRQERSKFPHLDALVASSEKITKTLLRQSQLPKEDEENEENEEGAGLVRLSDDLITALEMGLEQKQLLIKRSKQLSKAVAACAAQAVNEPLYKIFTNLEIKSYRLFGWSVFALALEEMAEKQKKLQKDLRKRKTTIIEKKSSIFNKLRKGVGDKSDESRQIEVEEDRSKRLARNITQELESIEKSMVNEFWAAYRQAALTLVRGKAKGIEEIFIRAFLRWGALGYSPRYIDRKVAVTILMQCGDAVKEPQYGLKASNVLYSDEVIALSAHGKIPSSPNEELELNHRNTPEWRADRSLRRIINCRINRSLLQDTLKYLDSKLIEARQELELSEKRTRHIAPNSKENKQKLLELKQQVQNCKVAIGRFERLGEKIRHNLLPKREEEEEMARSSLEHAGTEVSHEDLALHEVNFTRRCCRLVAKLKEPFLPFCLRDNFKLDKDVINDRTAIIAAITSAEQADPMLFKEPLVPVQKKANRILIRYSPLIVITPCMGIMGFMSSPRLGIDSGRLIVPGYIQRSSIRDEIIFTILSDYRYDTSKANAGVDVMNSDTLVAAYSKVRWNVRKKDREARQKMAIYTEENERANWRRHYELYMKSAFENGKLLYYKCPELYDSIINKFIELPEGGEKLRK